MAKSIKYDPSWESLDKRPIPGWFLDSKFGAFIMWGDYSVPAFADENSYSEFYEYFLKADEKMIESETYGNISFKNQDTEFTPESLGQYIRKNSAIVKDFHYRTYGKDFRYENFLDIFKAELFDPVLWAEIFSKAGIKYIIAAAKHHGGYCMFPSEHEAKSWGYYKDSVHIGPKRDLLGEIFDAMRGKNIKPGIYYSMYEWLNPLWLTDRGLFVEQVTVPQIKDIVIRYEPLNIWNDGDWLMGYKDWRSEEILAWLFNESPVASEIVVNNRWGGDDRLHGSYYTTECGGGFKDAAHPWEETHGIDSSFGYKRNSTYFEHKSAKRLIHTLVDIVSRGGNYLLAIPPRADGRIPNLIVERLTQIGSWLDVNGEA
ncbi:MAG: alpha-L-fucosidase, partial [Actinobacteria bacterium]|nr:alpha-L-fucosidase [Actinomycetota bacterium]